MSVLIFQELGQERQGLHFNQSLTRLGVKPECDRWKNRKLTFFVDLPHSAAYVEPLCIGCSRAIAPLGVTGCLGMAGGTGEEGD